MNINEFLKRTMPFCKNDIKDIIHLFYTCPISHNIVKQIEGKLNIVLNDYGENLELCTHHVIFGYTDGTKHLEALLTFVYLY